MAVDVAGTLAGLDALVERVHDATRDIVSDVADLLQKRAIENAPVGVEGNTTNPPGDLKRSIEVDGPHGADGAYTAEVGPTVVTANPGRGGRIYNYGRQREFGGTIRPRISPRLVFTSFGVTFAVPSVTQEGSHYLLRARTEAQPAIEASIEDHLAIAVEG